MLRITLGFGTRPKEEETNKWDISYAGTSVLITAFERLIEADLAVRKGFILAVQ